MAMTNTNGWQPQLSSVDVEDRAEKHQTEHVDHVLERTYTGDTEYDLEKTMTGPNVQLSATGQALQEDDGTDKIELHTFLACLAISFLWTGSQIPLYMLLVVIDYTLKDIGGADIQIWYVLGPLIALAATAPIAGSISDIFGRRWTVLAGGCCLIIGLILIGTTSTPAQNIVSFPFTGIGAGLLEINALAAVNEIAPNKLRGFYTSMLTWTIVPFAPLGIYAFTTAHTGINGWRWSIWIPLIWVGIGQIMTFFMYHPPARMYHGHIETASQKLRRVDWLGFILSLSASTLFLFGLGTGGYSSPWKSAQTIVPLILGFLLFIVLGFWQTKAKNPLYPPGMFKNTRVFILTLIITFVAGANFFSILILWPKYIIAVFDPSPVHGGLMIMAQTAGVLFGAGAFSWAITTFQGSIRPQMVLSCAMMMAGFGGLYSINTSRDDLAAVLVLIGCIGVGGIVIPASVITQLCTPDEYLGVVTALTFVARVLGGGVGFTIYYYVLNKDMNFLFADYAHNKDSLNVVKILLSKGFDTAKITKFITLLANNDYKNLIKMPGVDDNLIVFTSFFARPIWVEGFQNVWLITLAFSGLGLICSLFLGDVRKYMTSHRSVVYH